MYMYGIPIPHKICQGGVKIVRKKLVGAMVTRYFFWLALLKISDTPQIFAENPCPPKFWCKIYDTPPDFCGKIHAPQNVGTGVHATSP